MRQNVTIALLSVIATLLLVAVLSGPRSVSGQTGGSGSATVGGEIAVATGATQGGGGGAAFYLFIPQSKKLAVYYLGNNGLEVRAVRDVTWDLDAPDFWAQPGKITKVADMKKAIKKLQAGEKETGPEGSK